MSDAPGLAADIEDRLKRQGAASYAMNDGQMFVFTREILERLLVAAIESGANRAAVFVKRGPQS